MQNILFFDGKCSLCAHEIALLKRWKDNDLTLLDIHSEQCQELADGISTNTLLSILHLKNRDGSWATGLDATVSAWRHTRFGWVFRPLRWAFIAPIADWAYLRWASKRACKLGYSDACQIPESR